MSTTKFTVAKATDFSTGRVGFMLTVKLDGYAFLMSSMDWDKSKYVVHGPDDKPKTGKIQEGDKVLVEGGIRYFKGGFDEEGEPTLPRIAPKTAEINWEE